MDECVALVDCKARPLAMFIRVGRKGRNEMPTAKQWVRRVWWKKTKLEQSGTHKDHAEGKRGWERKRRCKLTCLGFYFLRCFSLLPSFCDVGEPVMAGVTALQRASAGVSFSFFFLVPLCRQRSVRIAPARERQPSVSAQREPCTPSVREGRSI